MSFQTKVHGEIGGNIKEIAVCAESSLKDTDMQVEASRLQMKQVYYK